MVSVPGKNRFLGALAAGLLTVPAVTMADANIEVSSVAVNHGAIASVEITVNAAGEVGGVNSFEGTISYPLPASIAGNPDPYVEVMSTSIAPGWTGTINVNMGAKTIDVDLETTDLNAPATVNGVVAAQIDFDTNFTPEKSALQSLPWSGVGIFNGPAGTDPVSAINPAPVNGAIAISVPFCAIDAVEHGNPMMGGMEEILAPPGGGPVEMIELDTGDGCAYLAILDAAGLNNGLGFASEALGFDYPFEPALMPGENTWLSAVDPGDPIIADGTFTDPGVMAQSGFAINLVQFMFPPPVAGANAIGAVQDDAEAVFLAAPNNTPNPRYVFVRFGDDIAANPPAALGAPGNVDEVVLITQPPCDFTNAIDPGNTDYDCDGNPNAGDMIAFGAMLDPTCAWTITSMPDWISIDIDDADDNPADVFGLTSAGLPYNGLGPATITITVDPNFGPARSEDIVFEWYDGAGGGVHTINQDGGCDVDHYEVMGVNDSDELGIDPMGADDLMFDIFLTDEACVVTGFNPAPPAWLIIDNIGPVTDDGMGNFFQTVTYDIAPNPGPDRNFDLNPEFSTTTCRDPQDFQVAQLCGCVIEVQPENVLVDVGGGIGLTFDILDQGCEYNVTVDQPWVTLNDVGGAMGFPGPFGPAGMPGNPVATTVNYDVADNAGGVPRTAIVTVTPDCLTAPAAQFLICQDGVCEVSAVPSDIVVPSTYSSASFDVIAPAPADAKNGFFEYTGAPVPIPDGNGIPADALTGDVAIATLEVPDEGFITDLEVTVNITHGRGGELKVWLMHLDSGTIIQMIDQPGGIIGPPFGDVCLAPDIMVDLSDEASTGGLFPINVEDICPIAGEARPDTPLSTFDGLPMRGTWALIASDQFEGVFTGQIDSFRLEIDYQPIGCAWEIVGDAVDGVGDPLNGNGIPSWIDITNVSPINMNGIIRYVGSGSSRVNFDVLPTPSELARNAELRVVPFTTAVGDACDQVFNTDPATVNITQWADCLYTIDPKKNTVGAAASTDHTFTIQTNQGFGVGNAVASSDTEVCVNGSSDTQIGVLNMFDLNPLATVTNAVLAIEFEKQDGACGTPHGGGSPFNDEIELILTAPDSTAVTLVPSGHFNVNPYGGVITYVFSDTGASIPPGAISPSGTYDAAGGASMADFDGLDAFGTWELSIADNLGADAFNVFSWTLSLEVEQPLGPLNACTWRLDDIVDWSTVTRIDYPDLPVNPPAGELGHDPNLPVNPIIFGDPGFPADADNFQGEGTAIVTYDVAENPTPEERIGWIEVGTEAGLYKHEICQVPDPCVYDIVNDSDGGDPLTGTYVSTAGDGFFELNTSNLCCWRLTENVEWLEINTFPQGMGNVRVDFTLLDNLGPERRTFIFVTDCDDNIVNRYEVVQSPGCDLRIDSFLSVFPFEGGTDSFDVIIGDGCAWEAVVSSDLDPLTIDPCPWVTIVGPASGLSDGTVTYTVDPNAGIERECNILVTYNGVTRVHNIVQASGCIISTSTPGPFAVPAAGSVENVQVDGVTVDCPYTTVVDEDAATNLPYDWISITSGGTGTVADTVEVTLAPNPGPARSGSITIIGENNEIQVVFNQANGCTLESLTDADADDQDAFNQEGGTGQFTVNLADNVGGNVGMGEEADCGWTAVSDAPGWLTILEGNDGTGTDNVVFSVAPFFEGVAPGFDRVGTITVTTFNNSLVYTVTQTDECEPIVTPADEDYNHSTQSGSFVLTGMDDSCPWTASINYVSGGEGWLSLKTGQEGIGNGLFTYDVAAYFDGPDMVTPRVAEIIVTPTNQRPAAVHTVSQVADCDLLALVPASRDFNHEGGSGNVTVSFAAGGTLDCVWNIEILYNEDAGAQWVNVQDTFNGVGDGNISYEVLPYTGAGTRTATLVVFLPNGDSEQHDISQTNECDPLVSDDDQAPAKAASVTLDHSEQSNSFILSGMFLTCPWDAEIEYTSGAGGWLTLTSGNDGEGDQLITYEVDAYFSDPEQALQQNPPAPTRTATVTITSRDNNVADAVYTITQEDDCDLLPLQANAASYTQAGGFGSFQVLFAAGGTVDCVWTVEVDAIDSVDSTEWISITSGIDGVGNSIISYEVEEFFNSSQDNMTRQGTITVRLPNGDFEVHTVTQNDFCEPNVNPESYVLDQNGGCRTIEVFFGQDPDGEFDCHWIARIRYEGQTLGTGDDCTMVNGDGPDEPWVTIMEGSTEGHGDGSVTYCVDEYFNCEDPERIAYIEVIADNCLVATHQITQRDECNFCLFEDADGQPILVKGTSNDNCYTPECDLKYYFDHNGRLTGPIFDPDEDNTGTASFHVVFDSEDGFIGCGWRAEVVEGEGWINIVEGSTGEGNGQVFFEIDPNVVAGPDVAREGTIVVTSENGQFQIVEICQSEGYYILDEFELGETDDFNGFSFGPNNLVIGYTNLNDKDIPTINTPNAGESDSFVIFDSKSGRVLECDPSVEADARGFFAGFVDVSVYSEFNDDDKGSPSLFLGSFEVPVTGRINFSRTASREVNTGDNGYNGFTTARFKNKFSLKGKDKLRGTFSASGRENYNVVPPELNNPTGFEVKTKATSKLDGAAAKGNGFSILKDWVPTSANLAISKNTFVPESDNQLRWTSDLLMLDSGFSAIGEQNDGVSSLRISRFIRERGKDTGKFNWSGQLGRTANNKFKVSGFLQLTFENASSEGFWLDANPEALFGGDDLQDGEGDTPPDGNPGAIRGLTLFPTSISFNNSQVKLKTKEKWNENLVLNPEVTTPPSQPAP